MTFKRALAFMLLAVTVLASFAACKTEEKPVEETALDISGYTIVKPDITSKDITETISNFKKYLLSYTGAELKVSSDWYNPTQTLDESGYEILVGNTNRTVSADYIRP